MKKERNTEQENIQEKMIQTDNTIQTKDTQQRILGKPEEKIGEEIGGEERAQDFDTTLSLIEDFLKEREEQKDKEIGDKKLSKNIDGITDTIKRNQVQGLPIFIQKIRSGYSCDEEMFDLFLSRFHELKAFQNMRKEQLQRAKKLYEKAEKQTEKQKKFIDMMLRVIHGQKYYSQKIKLVSGNLSYRISKKTEVLDEATLPSKYIKEVVSTSVDKTTLLADLKDGQTIPGAKLAVSYNVQCK